MVKKHNAPPGCDYDPVVGADANTSYGTVRAGDGKTRRSLADVIVKRLFPVDRPTDPVADWPAPTCHAHDILLPRGAPDYLADYRTLAREYHAHSGDAIDHLATIITFRFPDVDAVPSRGPARLHDIWELCRGFGGKLRDDLQVAVLPVFHVPGKNWGLGCPHVHLICPVRVIRPATGFSIFVPQLINAEQGRSYIDAEWKTWCEEAGYGD
jgi:hypothetical protein